MTGRNQFWLARGLAVRMRRFLILAFFALLLLAVFLGTAKQRVRGENTAIILPTGFVADTVASGLVLPLDMEFLPSGELLVAEKGTGSHEEGISNIKLVRNGIVQSPPALSLSTNTYWDSGALAIVLDPDFANNHAFYVWYATGKDALAWSGESILRLSRFILDLDSGLADPASETILFESEPWEQWHHGNGLLFDQQGNLLLASGNRGYWEVAQDPSSLAGKILRIRLTEDGYEIPADNPFVGNPDFAPEIYAMGLRNPYRLADRNSDGLVVVGDVGDQTWEEIDILQPAANYGYPEREGPCPLGQFLPCEPAPAPYTDPIFSYEHNAPLGQDTGGAVTGMDFYEGSSFPDEYHGKLFFADFNQYFIATGDMASGNVEMFAQNADSVADIEYHGGNLYLLNLVPGRITLISYDGADNQAPTAVMSADPLLGPAPHTVNFSAAGSSDPDDVVLRYHWDFGDGSPTQVSSETEIEHTFESDGTYQASLQVVDVRGVESTLREKTITVYSGEFPEINLTNLTDMNRQQFHGGDEIEYEALRSNMDGLDDQTPFLWQIDFQHNQHAHPIIADSAVLKDVLPIAIDGHGGDWNVWFRFYLTMLTDTGQQVTISKELFPELVDLTVEARPRSLEVIVDHAGRQTPHLLRSVVGTTHELAAMESMVHNKDIWVFSHWQSQGSLVSNDMETVILAPEQGTTYTAAYVYDRPAQLTWLPAVRRAYEFLPQNGNLRGY